MKWFRLYTEIIDDPKVYRLTPEQRWALIGLFALSAQEEKAGSIPYSIEQISWRLRCEKEFLENTLSICEKEGIIQKNGNGLKIVNWCKRQFKSDNPTDRWRKWKESTNVGQTLAPTVPESDKNRTENTINTLSGISPQNSADESCPHKKIIELYHTVLADLPKVRIWNPTRQGLLRARWNYSEKTKHLEWWQDFFEYIKQSDFLMGRKTDWRADLPWIIKADNFAKIVDGRYHR